MIDLRGVFAILATPFDPDEDLDEVSMRDLVEWELAAGVHGLTILGIFGEAHRLSDAERSRVVRIVVDQVKGRVPVVVGTGHASAKIAAAFSREAQDLGADAVMVFPSPFAKGVAAIRAYYATVVAATALPVVVQDEPAFTGIHLPAPLLAELAEAHPSVAYVKLEEPPTPPKVSEILRLTDRLAIFGGLGGVFFLEELLRGAVGTMTGFAFPELLLGIYRAHAERRPAEARAAFDRVLPILRYENQAGISLALRKEILLLRGVIRHSTVRQPMRTLDPQTRAELVELLQSLGLDPYGGAASG